MISLLHAEFIKILRNRIIFIFTVGTLPILTIALLIGLTLATLSGVPMGWNVINWHEQVILALLVPNNIIGQALFVALGATIFGGEGSWQTSKLIVPLSKRWQLIVSKFIVTATAIFLSINGVALMTFIGSWMIALAAEKPFVNGAWGNMTDPFIVQYSITFFAIFAAMLVGAIFAALAAVVSNSISGGVIIGIILSVVDSLSLAMLTLASMLLQNDSIKQIAKLMPNFNIQNMLGWLFEGNGLEGQSFWLSALIVLIWILGGIALTTIVFIRRDIN